MTDVFQLFIKCTRAYSLPMSVMAWLIPFVYGVFSQGNIFYGLIAFLGIISLHLAANMFDDFVDFQRHKKIKNNLQKGKCSYFLDNQISEFSFLFFMSVLFLLALFVGFYFIYLYKTPIIIIMALTSVLCLIYPFSSYFGCGEIIIGTIFSPMVFIGVYYVMMQKFSLELLALSLPFAIMVVVLLYTHSFLDFNYDMCDGKKTICLICRNKKFAYYFLIFLIFFAYFSTLIALILKVVSLAYFLTFFALLPAISLCKSVYNYIDKEPQNEQEFLCVFNKAQNLTVVYTILTIISIIITYI